MIIQKRLLDSYKNFLQTYSHKNFLQTHIHTNFILYTRNYAPHFTIKMYEGLGFMIGSKKFKTEINTSIKITSLTSFPNQRTLGGDTQECL